MAFGQPVKMVSLPFEAAVFSALIKKMAMATGFGILE